MKKYFSVFLVLLFACATFSPIAFAAEIENSTYIDDRDANKIIPYASLYLKGQRAWCSATSAGKIEIFFQVTATSKMNSVGATDIYIYEKNNGSWIEVKHFSSYNTSGMLKYDTSFCASSVIFSGTPGKEYKAIVTAYAGNDSSRYDSVDIETSTVTAKN